MRPESISNRWGRLGDPHRESRDSTTAQRSEPEKLAERAQCEAINAVRDKYRSPLSPIEEVKRKRKIVFRRRAIRRASESGRMWERATHAIGIR